MVISLISISLLSGIMGILWYCTKDTHIVRIKKGQVMEFKSAMDLSGLPIIVFYQGKNKYNFLLDTGSNVSYVNKDSGLVYSEALGKDTFTCASGIDTDCSVSSTKLYHGDTEYECFVRVTDLGAAFTEVKNSYGIQLSGILGNDFFTKYKYCLDFKELVCYVRK